MSLYKTGRVYKIMYIGNENVSITYVGSTFNTLRDRKQGHKDNFKKWDNDSKNKCLTIFPYYQQLGIDNFKILLIKEYQVVDRNHLLALEQLWMNKINCINNQKAFQPLKREHITQYRDKRKDTTKTYNKQYSQANKDKLAEQARIKYTCQCGGKYTKHHKARHEKTNKHQNYLN